jgi:shikimate 5-dehydrogenase
MTLHLNKDTTVCMSLAARPSNFGTRFHNYLYDALGLDYLYKAFTTTDLASAIAAFGLWVFAVAPSPCRLNRTVSPLWMN